MLYYYFIKKLRMLKSSLTKVCQFSAIQVCRNHQIRRNISRYSNYCFSTHKEQRGNNTESNYPKYDIKLALLQIKQQIKKDLSNNISHFQEPFNKISSIKFSQIKQMFVGHLQKQIFNSSNQVQLIEVLGLVSKYPKFTLPNSAILLIYRIICKNLHLKQEKVMNELLKFVLVADSNVSQSPIFHEFIRFYLQVPMEQLKFKYQIDLQNLTLYQSLKQLSLKLLQRGFLSRSPLYFRNLNLFDHDVILQLLVFNEQTKTSLMVKKINYTIFMDIKQFYERQMKENLYSHRKVELLDKFTKSYLKVISEKIQSIQNQTVHLRQLYMKLYLTLPEQHQFDQIRADWKQLEVKDIQTKLGTLKAYKFKNVIYLYRSAIDHIATMDHLKLDEIDQNIDTVIEFVQKVESNFALIHHISISEMESLNLETEQILFILKLIITSSQHGIRYHNLVNFLEKEFTSFKFELFFDLYLQLFRRSNPQQIARFIFEFDHFQLLSLENLYRLNSTLQQNKQNREIQQTILTNIFKKVLSTNFQLITGKEIIYFLKFYQSYLDASTYKLKFLPQTHQKHRTLIHNSQVIRIFTMRYISDHHTQFSLSQFEDIVNILIIFPSQVCRNFDDQSHNYPRDIFSEIDTYLSKVKILFSSKTRQILEEKNVSYQENAL